MKNFSYELTPIPPKEKINVFAEDTDMLILMIYISGIGKLQKYL